MSEIMQRARGVFNNSMHVVGIGVHVQSLFHKGMEIYGATILLNQHCIIKMVGRILKKKGVTKNIRKGAMKWECT
jgi:hypothetical protein